MTYRVARFYFIIFSWNEVEIRIGVPSLLRLISEWCIGFIFHCVVSCSLLNFPPVIDPPLCRHVLISHFLLTREMSFLVQISTWVCFLLSSLKVSHLLTVSEARLCVLCSFSTPLFLWTSVEFVSFFLAGVRISSLSYAFCHLERGSDRQSDESSKKADSDSHPENWTDHEHSDPQQPLASPPHAPLAQSESLEKAPKEFKVNILLIHFMRTSTILLL